MTPRRVWPRWDHALASSAGGLVGILLVALALRFAAPPVRSLGFGKAWLHTIAMSALLLGLMVGVELGGRTVGRVDRGPGTRRWGFLAATWLALSAWLALARVVLLPHGTWGLVVALGAVLALGAALKAAAKKWGVAGRWVLDRGE